jgi:hypothetical protein
MATKLVRAAATSEEDGTRPSLIVVCDSDIVTLQAMQSCFAAVLHLQEKYHYKSWDATNKHIWKLPSYLREKIV